MQLHFSKFCNVIVIYTHQVIVRNGQIPFYLYKKKKKDRLKNIRQRFEFFMKEQKKYAYTMHLFIIQLLKYVHIYMYLLTGHKNSYNYDIFRHKIRMIYLGYNMICIHMKLYLATSLNYVTIVKLVVKLIFKYIR